MILKKIPICLSCSNYIGNFECSAFPDGIPDEIVTGENDHKTPLKDQKNPITFERLPYNIESNG